MIRFNLQDIHLRSKINIYKNAFIFLNEEIRFYEFIRTQ